MTGQYTLDATERAVAERVAGMPVDHEAMAAVANLYRAAGVVRNHFERSVLTEHELTWTGWVVLWVVWVWGEVETRTAASEAGISKSTLTGVAATLQSRGLLLRKAHPEDGRRVLLSLTDSAQTLMAEVFPRFNAQESRVVEPLTKRELAALTDALRRVIHHLET